MSRGDSRSPHDVVDANTRSSVRIAERMTSARQNVERQHSQTLQTTNTRSWKNLFHCSVWRAQQLLKAT